MERACATRGTCCVVKPSIYYGGEKMGPLLSRGVGRIGVAYTPRADE